MSRQAVIQKASIMPVTLEGAKRLDLREFSLVERTSA